MNIIWLFMFGWGIMLVVSSLLVSAFSNRCFASLGLLCGIILDFIAMCKMGYTLIPSVQVCCFCFAGVICGVILFCLICKPGKRKAKCSEEREEMKLLILVEKPAIKQRIEQEFAKCIEEQRLGFTMDVACVTGFIVADEDAERLSMNTEHFEPFTMKTRNVPENFKIVRNYLPHMRGDLPALLQHNSYDFVVNACDPDEAGLMMFDYTRESCDILNIPTFRTSLCMDLWVNSMPAMDAFARLQQVAVLLKGESFRKGVCCNESPQ